MDMRNIGSVKVGSKVIVKGLDMNCNEIFLSSIVVKNGKDSVIRGKDGIDVMIDGDDTEFWIDLPVVRKRIGIVY
jgi:hypothetical protein